MNPTTAPHPEMVEDFVDVDTMRLVHVVLLTKNHTHSFYVTCEMLHVAKYPMEPIEKALKEIYRKEYGDFK